MMTPTLETSRTSGLRLERVRFAMPLLLAAFLALAGGCDRKPSGTSGDASGGPAGADFQPAGPTIDLVFTYGSEKKNWIDDVTRAFNRSQAKIANGKIVQVKAIPMGSGECIDEILENRREVHLTSPASAAFVQLGNAKSQAQSGEDLLGPTENLVVSPVVIAMWKPMAEAIGWGTKPVGWAEIIALAKDPKGWETYGHGEWGQFKFGHTHPEYSNSGLISVLAEVYAGAGKAHGLSADDVARTQTAQFLADVERAVVHYGSSTGFFGDRMMEGGPQYLSAAVLYESVVVDSYQKQNLPFPIVAIYPKEGTFWSDHPVGVVQRKHVTAEHKEAAKLYVDYLLARPQQERAMVYGFRPGDTNVPLAAPIDAAHGVDAHEPKSVLEVPPADRMNQVLQLWHRNKKHANVVLVFDVSGSMQEDNKIGGARDGAAELIRMLDDEDYLSLLPFSSQMRWAGRDLLMGGGGREQAMRTVSGLFPGGETALFDSISVAHRALLQGAKPGRIAAIVVLTDGEDNKSRLTIDALCAQLKARGEAEAIRIFTIGYGTDARKDVLKRIADQTRAKYYDGTTKNIREVFKDIATFF